ncbi:MAG: DUF1343 domain-containing protein [Myxococcota bacterium]|jgi:uncharacterized protein YbbC (DUF1343 family)
MKVVTGLERFHPAGSGKALNACLVCHQASVDSALQRSADLLASAKGVRLKWLLGPEHGLYGVEQDMIGVGGGRDGATGLPVESLYGRDESTLGPPKKVLGSCDTLIFDLQDIGSRHYTFFATLVHCMKACAEAGVRVVVLDRPNPIGGVAVEGNGVKPGFESFVGVHNLAVRHGMTMGELALMVDDEAGMGCRLEIIPMDGWRRGMMFARTGLPWVAPSPNMPTTATALVYPGMCLVEGTNLSEGRGTTRPFELFGAPFIEPFRLVKKLRSYRLPGVAFRAEWFRPQFHKFAGELCGGAQVHVTDPAVFRPYLTGAAVLLAVKTLWPGSFGWRSGAYEFVKDIPAIDLLFGCDAPRKWIGQGRPLRVFREFFDDGGAEFCARRKQYLIYR